MSDFPTDNRLVPQGWNKSRLGDKCSWLSGGTRGGTPSNAIPRFWSESIPWVSPKDMKVFRIADAIDHVSSEAVKAGSRLIEEGTVLIVIRGMILAHSFPVAITVRPVAFNQDIKALICGADVSAEYLAYWLVAESDHILSIVSESTHGTKRFDLADLRNLRFDTPPPSEQRKIARILTTVDNLIERTEALIAKYQAIKQGMMHDLFTRGVDSRGHLRPPYEEALELYKQSELGWIPKEWELSCVQNEFEISTGFTLDTHRRPTKNIRPYLRVANVQRDEIRLDDVAMLEATVEEFESRKLRLNDLLVVEGHADPNQIGRCSLVTPESAGLTFQNPKPFVPTSIFDSRSSLRL